MWHNPLFKFENNNAILSRNSNILPEYSVGYHLLLVKYVLSTMGVSKESISKFLIGLVMTLNLWRRVLSYKM